MPSDLGASEAAASQKKGLYSSDAVFPSWIVFSVLSILLGFATFILNAMLLQAQRAIECTYMRAVGGVMLVFGLLIVVGGALAARFKVLQPDAEAESRRSKAGRYVFFGASIIIAAFIMFLCVFAGAVYSMSRSVPSIKHNYRSLRALESTVRITRDENGIPHIYAGSLHDAFFGQGFVHAQDRLFQLEMTRLVAQGRLAEHLGSAAVEVDEAIRTLGITRAAGRMCERLSPEDRERAAAYAAGINAFLREESVRPPEFMFMNKRGTFFIPHDPEDFTVENVCQMGKVLQWQISTNVNDESTRWKLFGKLGLAVDEVMDLYFISNNETTRGKTILEAEDLGISEADAAAARARDAATLAAERTLFDEYMWRFRENETSPVPLAGGEARRHANLVDGTAEPAAPSAQQRSTSPWARDLLSRVLGFSDLRGSNAWMARRANTPPVGASDPHLGAVVPSFWHHAHLVYQDAPGGERREASGVVMPGVPGVLVGRNDNVSWGITMALTDIQDMYVMVPDPAQPSTHYMYHGESLAYERRIETIKVAGGSDRRIEVLTSVLGPIVSGVFELSNVHRIALNTTVFADDDDSFASLLGMMHATSAADFYNRLANVSSPPLSICFADSSGVIGHVVTARHPIRAVGHTGRIPILGNGSYDILGFVPFHEMPHKIDANIAEDGFTAAGNQRITPDGYKHQLGWDSHPPFRGAVLKSRLRSATSEELGNLSFAVALQTDTFSGLFDQEFAPFIVDDRNGYRSELHARLSSSSQQWLQRLSEWNRRADFGSEETAFFWSWAFEISKLPQDVLRHLDVYTWRPLTYAAMVAFRPSNIMLRRCAAAVGESSPTNSSCLEYVARAMDTVARRSATKWGTDYNRLKVRHQLFAKTLLGCIFDRDSMKDGDMSSINVASASSGDLESPIITTHIASMRQLYDWSQPDRMYFSLPGGNSGHPWSEFYMNLLGMLVRGEYATVSFGEVRGVASQELSP